ncbi:MAG TPA: 3-phosphoshikimate 1-carboxyvinyltransferase [Kofleriaceae bacterium]|nr:3-phosphoshikimate 1-carboxyvinyltransferase [Kofleriaceae bacterium]
MTAFLVEPIDHPPSGARLEVPGDKSIGHRSLLFGALCDGVVEVSGLSGGQDNARTRAAVDAMGARVDELGPGRVRVHGVGVDGLRAPSADLDCGNSGTSMRLLCGLLAGQRFTTRLTGDPSLSGRPMRRVAEPLAQMGARVDGASREGRPGEIYPPLTVHGVAGALRGIDISLAVASAQVKSAILLAGLYADGAVRVREPGPSRDHTERMLAHLGAPLEVLSDGQVVLDVRGWDRRLATDALAVPGDPSSSAFLVVAALVSGAVEVEVAGVCMNPTRTGFLDVLVELGATVARHREREVGGEPVADLVISAATSGWDGLHGAVMAGATTVRSIDEIPILAVLAARAAGTTEFRDAAELRVKESDRIATTCAMLRAFGVDVEEQPSGLSVSGRPGQRLRAARIDSAGDHRIAMAATVAALAADGPSRIDDVDNVATSYPGFADALNRLAGRAVCTAAG